ncbi:hypothetical protein [Pseudohaliea sp.]|uniref:hypothetical protein n=1 Tax=Pseudohaliea sp. TaxID=2740289 RepID=UPI0032EF6861
MQHCLRKTIPLFLLAAVLSGCKIQISSPIGGSVTTASGSYRCGASETCVVEVEDATFDESFTAAAEDGYEFLGWSQKQRGFCGGRTNACALRTTGFPGNPSLMQILRSEETFYLDPIIRPLNTLSFMVDLWTDDYFVINSSRRGVMAVRMPSSADRIIEISWFQDGVWYTATPGPSALSATGSPSVFVVNTASTTAAYPKQGDGVPPGERSLYRDEDNNAQALLDSCSEGSLEENIDGLLLDSYSLFLDAAGEDARFDSSVAAFTGVGGFICPSTEREWAKKLQQGALDEAEEAPVIGPIIESLRNLQKEVTGVFELVDEVDCFLDERACIKGAVALTDPGSLGSFPDDVTPPPGMLSFTDVAYRVTDPEAEACNDPGYLVAKTFNATEGRVPFDLSAELIADTPGQWCGQGITHRWLLKKEASLVDGQFVSTFGEIKRSGRRFSYVFREPGTYFLSHTALLPDGSVLIRGNTTQIVVKAPSGSVADTGWIIFVRNVIREEECLGADFPAASNGVLETDLGYGWSVMRQRGDSVSLFDDRTYEWAISGLTMVIEDRTDYVGGLFESTYGEIIFAGDFRSFSGFIESNYPETDENGNSYQCKETDFLEGRRSTIDAYLDQIEQDFGLDARAAARAEIYGDPEKYVP